MSKTIRSGKNESRNTGSHWGEDHLQQCHLLQCLALILYLSVVVFQINMLLMLLLL